MAQNMFQLSSVNQSLGGREFLLLDVQSFSSEGRMDVRELRRLPTSDLVAKLLAIIDILVERVQGASDSWEDTRPTATSEHGRSPAREPRTGGGRRSQQCFFCSTACARRRQDMPSIDVESMANEEPDWEAFSRKMLEMDSTILQDNNAENPYPSPTEVASQPSEGS